MRRIHHDQLRRTQVIHLVCLGVKICENDDELLDSGPVFRQTKKMFLLPVELPLKQVEDLHEVLYWDCLGVETRITVLKRPRNHFHGAWLIFSPSKF